MNFELNQFQQLFKEAQESLFFDEITGKLESGILAIKDGQGPPIPALQRNQLIKAVQQYIDLIQRRKTDPRLFKAALKSYLSATELSEENYNALEEWFHGVVYATLETVDPEIISFMRALRDKSKFCVKQALYKDLELSIKRFADISKYAVNTRETLQYAHGLEARIRAMELDESNYKGLMYQIAGVRTETHKKEEMPIGNRTAACLNSYEQTLNSLEKEHFDRHTSYVLQVSFFRNRQAIEESEIDDEQKELLIRQLDKLEARFDPVRYLSSTTLYLRNYEPKISEIRNAIQQTLDFDNILKAIDNLRKQSQQGKKEGADKLAKYHKDIIEEAAKKLNDMLNRRCNDPEALTREVRRLIGEVNELEGKQVLFRGTLSHIQKQIKMAEHWAEKINKNLLETLRDLKLKCSTIGDNIDERYQNYVDSQINSIHAFENAIPQMDDMGDGFKEIQSLSQVMNGQDTPLKERDRQYLLKSLSEVKRRFFERFNNVEEINTAFDTLNKKVNKAAMNLHYAVDLTKLSNEIKGIEFRVKMGRFPHNDKEYFEVQIRKTYGRLRELRKKHEEYLERRAADQAAVFDELSNEIEQCAQMAQERPGHHTSWENLVNAGRQVREEKLLSGEQRQKLFSQLDKAFSMIREERARFARQACVVYGEYADIIQNILAPLEQTIPRPTREDAFDATEALKPLRIKLRNERRLLASHRTELEESLRNVSDAITEILDQASNDMYNNYLHIQRQIDGLTGKIKNVKTSPDLTSVISEHKELYAAVRTTELSMQGRRECRSKLEALWSLISEKKQDFSYSRFDPSKVNETLARLEMFGHFLWMDEVPPRIV
ncbi:MAG: hypothetical protein NT166_07495 [Candidatus Aminicenantes bacterium]|nr:hypothetical protein [Candidatus Aminicenantes bacterium]